jgi:hypothetical protein
VRLDNILNHSKTTGVLLKRDFKKLTSVNRPRLNTLEVNRFRLLATGSKMLDVAKVFAAF